MTLARTAFGYLGRGGGGSQFSEQRSRLQSHLQGLWVLCSSAVCSSSLAATCASVLFVASVLRASFSSAIFVTPFSSVPFWSTSFSCSRFSASCFNTSASWDLDFSFAASNLFWISSRERSFPLGGERGYPGTDSFGQRLRISSKAWPEARFSSSFTWISGFDHIYNIFRKMEFFLF